MTALEGSGTLTFPTRHGPVQGDLQGKGPLLVLLHGNPGSSKDFREVIPELSRQHRVLALDWPGYGATPAPTPPESASSTLFTEVLFDVLESLAEPAIPLGNSVGGYAAIRAAVEKPEKVLALVLVNPAGFTPRDGLTRLVCTIRGSRFGARYLAQPLAQLQLFTRTSTTASMVQSLVARSDDTLRVDAAVWRSFLNQEQDLRTVAGQVTAPTLLVWGRLDPTLPFERDGRRAVQALPRAHLELLDAGHAPFAECPQAFLSSVKSFLEKAR